MVYAFIIHTLLPGRCRVLYSSVFGADPGSGGEERNGSEFSEFDSVSETGLTTDGADPGEGPGAGSVAGGTPADHHRKAQKKYILQIAQDVHSEYAFRTKTTNRSFEKDMLTLQNEGTLPNFELGFFRCPYPQCQSPQPGQDAGERGRCKDNVAVWLAALNCAFVLVCKKHENRLVAESVLKLVIKHLVGHLRVLTQPTEVVLKPDKVTLVLRQFLPAGQLLPMNHRVIRQFEKELDTKMRKD